MKINFAWIVFVFLLAGMLMLLSEIEKADMRCIERGYPNRVIKGGEEYCQRLLNGTDEIVRLRDLEELER